MYYRPCRRGDLGVAGAPVRQISSDAHQGSYREYLRRHEMEAASAARGGKAAKRAFVNQLLSRTADTRNLRLAWNWIAHNGGQAPGADGLRFDDLDESDVWPFLRTVSKSILQETYRTTADRKKKIPKLKRKLAAAKTDGDREKILHKIRAVSPFWNPPEKK